MIRRLRAVLIAMTLVSSSAFSGFSAPSPEADPKPERPSRLWAIVIGIDQQIDPAIPDGRSSVRQANRMLGWLRNVAGWDRSRLLLLSDGGSDDPGLEAVPSPNIRPSRKNLGWAFDRWLRSKDVLPDDVILVFYAGKSMSVETAAGPSSLARHKTLLLPSDAFLQNLDTTGWSLDDAMEPYARRGAFRIVYWLSTNPSEQIKPANPPKPARHPGSDWIRRLTSWPNVTTWLAADQAGTPSTTNDDTSTLFSNALIDALNRPGRSNLATTLKTMEENPRLKLQGFQVAGGVPSSLTVRSDRLGRLATPEPPRMTIQVGHAGKVNTLIATADGRKVISAGSDATARVWSLDQKALLRVLSGHSVRVSAVAMSPDEGFLVTGGGRGSVLVHDLGRDFALKLSGPQPHLEEGGVEPSIERIIFLPDADRFVTIDNRGKAYLWNLDDPILAPKPWLPKVGIRDVVCAGDSATGTVYAIGINGAIHKINADGSNDVEFLNEATPTERTQIPAPIERTQAPAPTERTQRVVIERTQAPAPTERTQAPAPTERTQRVVIAVSGDGKRLAIGHEDGKITVRDLVDLKRPGSIEGKGVVRKLGFAGTNHLVVGNDAGVALVTIADDLSAAGRIPLTTEPASQWAIGPDGTSIAVCLAHIGAVRAWKIEGKEAREVLRDEKAGVYSVAYVGDGSKLVGGGIDVSVKTWDLKPGLEVSRGSTWASPLNSGKIQQVGTSPDRLFLLARSGAIARVWGLRDRSCRTVPGTWTSGLFANDTTMILTATADAEKSPGRPALVPLATLDADRSFFADKAEGFTLPENTAFEALTLSDDGKLVAASDSQSPLVCVWDVKTGGLLRWIETLDEPAKVLSFSDGGKLLASGGDGPVTSVWSIEPEKPPGPIEKPIATLRDPIGQTVTAVKVRPNNPGEIATGHRDGRVLLWKSGGARPQKPVTVVDRYFDGEVKAIAFSDDGKTLAASGDGNLIWLGQIEPNPRRIDGPGARPHHIDQINDLAFWPRVPILVSAGNDSAIHFWNLTAKNLWGTLSFAPVPDGRGGFEPEADWVLFTPEGEFDASPNGRDKVRYCERDQSKPLEQFDGTLYTFQLGERLRAPNLAKRANPLEAPIPLAIETAPREDADEPFAHLTVTIGSPTGTGPDDDEVLQSINDLRFYQNGVPIPTGLEDREGPPPRRFSIPVRLVEKINRFYLMAGRAGGVDSRSPDVEVAYHGRLEGGRVHVVSIGVGDYDRLRLTYATSDAESISQVLHNRGGDPNGNKGLLRILTNKNVSRDSLGEAFGDIARQCKNRPQDTVVVFLAGHTGVFENDRFCLLLSDFPFPKVEPLQVAMRGAITEIAEGTKLDASHTLPYATIMRNLMRVEALNRLVIVDACQAEAILVDPQVVEINKWMEIGSRRARTSYLLAARRGDPALEFDPLQHGLFTFTLLRGMGALPDDDSPEEVSKLGLPLNADANSDGLLTTRELRLFIENAMPRIAELFPKLVALRRSAIPTKGALPVPPTILASFSSFNAPRRSHSP